MIKLILLLLYYIRFNYHLHSVNQWYSLNIPEWESIDFYRSADALLKDFVKQTSHSLWTWKCKITLFFSHGSQNVCDVLNGCRGHLFILSHCLKFVILSQLLYDWHFYIPVTLILLSQLSFSLQVWGDFLSLRQ